MQYFLRTAEKGEGADCERELEAVGADEAITNKKKLFEEASTEVELLVENGEVMRALLLAVRTCGSLELAPDLDPCRRWFDPPWQAESRRPMKRFLDVPADELPRFRTAVLRTSVRCLRLMMQCQDGKTQLEACSGPETLNAAALAHPLDDFVQKDVKAIFSAVYGGENAVRRIVISGVPTTVELMRENSDSAIVQLSGVKRLCELLAGTNARRYSPSHSPGRSNNVTKEDDGARRALFQELATFGAVTLSIETLRRFDVDQYLALYVHVSRFIAYVAVEGEPMAVFI